MRSNSTMDSNSAFALTNVTISVKTAQGLEIWER